MMIAKVTVEYDTILGTGDLVCRTVDLLPVHDFIMDVTMDMYEDGIYC